MTRIVIDPPELRRAAHALEDTAAAYRQSVLRLRALPLPEMPAGVGAAVQAAIARTSVSLDAQVLPLANEAADLKLRASWAEIAGEAGEWPLGLGFVRDGGQWLRVALSIAGPGGALPIMLATAHGYRLVLNGGYVNVRGSRFPGNDLWSRYLRSGRIPGTRYGIDNPNAAKTLRLNAALDARMRELLPLDRRFLKAAGKGSGPLAIGLTLGGDVYEFTRGPQADKGVASSDFAATAIVDTGILGGTAAVGASASVGTAMVMGATMGSVVPGVGTVVGLAVAGGTAYFLTTGPGQAMRSGMISGTKSALEFAGRHPLVLAPPLPAAAAALEVYNHREDVVRAGKSGVNYAGEGVRYAGEGIKAVGSGLNDARKFVGGVIP